HLLEGAVLAEDPAHGLVGGGGVDDVAAVAILLHAEDAVVVADRAGEDVDAGSLGGDPGLDGARARLRLTRSRGSRVSHASRESRESRESRASRARRDLDRLAPWTPRR